MKAVCVRQHGGADKLIFGERPTPRPGPGEALLRVKACALNHLDVWVRMGIPGLEISLPRIPGCDAAGVVEKTGPGVPASLAGRRMMTSPGLSCGRCDLCRDGRDHLCPKFGILGQDRDGGYAEFVAVPVENLFPVPPHLGFEEAASFPLVFLTAWHMLVNTARVRAGESVLVQAAGSGVGIAAVQVAKLWGAKVFATVGSDDKAAKARGLGADEVVNYREKDFLTEVRRKTAKRGVDVVVEHVGKDTFEKSLLSLARGGRLVTCGATSGRDVRFDLRHLFGRNLTLHGTRLGPRKSLAEALKHLTAGRLHPVVDRTFPLARAADAHRYMEERKNFGKIVLTV